MNGKEIIDMYQMEVSDFTIDIVRKEIKNLHLSVYPPTGRVRIAAPVNVQDDTIRLFAISKLAWIKKNQRIFASQDRQTPRVYLERESHYFQGRRYLLQVVEHDAPPKIVIKTKATIELSVRPNTTIEQKHSILNEWYRKELKELIPALIEKWENVIEVKVEDWNVKQMKTKWGACNIEKSRIWVNLELAKKPVNCLEYIIVHEMIHLLERHHNERFLAYIDKFMPQWRKYKEELNKLPVSHTEWEY